MPGRRSPTCCGPLENSPASCSRCRRWCRRSSRAASACTRSRAAAAVSSARRARCVSRPGGGSRSGGTRRGSRSTARAAPLCGRSCTTWARSWAPVRHSRSCAGCGARRSTSRAPARPRSSARAMRASSSATACRSTGRSTRCPPCRSTSAPPPRSARASGRSSRVARPGPALPVASCSATRALAPEEFTGRFLEEPFDPDWLVVGEDFALGKGRAGNVERLRAIGRDLGYQVDALPLCVIDGAPVTSTRIRTLLAAGDVAAAARLLGRSYSFTGLVVGGDRVGRTLGFPTANLRLHDEQQVPALGIYAVWARIEGEAEWRMGAMSVGVRPTFGGGRRTLEVHLLDYEGDLYGKDLTVALASWLPAEQAFEGPEALVAAIRSDLG